MGRKQATVTAPNKKAAVAKAKRVIRARMNKRMGGNSEIFPDLVPLVGLVFGTVILISLLKAI